MNTQEITGSNNGVDHLPIGFTILLILFGFLIFSNTLNQYFLLDDFELLYSAKYNNLPQVLMGQDTNLENRFFRPVPMLLYWIQYKLFGPSPLAFHLTTILLHIACAVFSFVLFYVFSENARCSMIFGFIFVAFPNHAEAVNWPAINFTLCTTAFYLGSLALFGFYRLTSRLPFLLLSLVSFLAAALSNETAFTLPLSLAVFDFFLSKRKRISLPVQRRIREYSLYVGILLLLLVATRTFLWARIGYPTVGGENIIVLYLSDPYILASDLAKINFHAWRNLITPLSPEIPFRNHITLAVWVIFALVFIALVVKRRLDFITLAFCLCFTSIAILPMMGTYRFFNITHWIRHLYLPSVGSSFIVAMAIDGILRGIKGTAMRWALLVATITPLVILTKYYDGEWIQAQKENKEIVQQTVNYSAALPPHSRIYISDTPWTMNHVPRIDCAFPRAIGIYVDTKYHEAYMNFHPGDRPLALEREVYDERDWQYFWLRWDGETRTLIPEGSIQPSRSKEKHPYEFDFSNRSAVRGLKIANEMARLYDPGPSYPAYMVQGRWALLKLPPLNAEIPIKYLTLEMMLTRKDSKKDVARLFWITDRDLKYTGGKSISFFVMTDGEFHEYKIPLYKNGMSLIDPRITRFGIRPSQIPGTIFSIKKVAIEHY